MERDEILSSIKILESKVGTKFPDEPIDEEWIMNKKKLEILKRYDKDYKEV